MSAIAFFSRRSITPANLWFPTQRFCNFLENQSLNAKKRDKSRIFFLIRRNRQLRFRSESLGSAPKQHVQRIKHNEKYAFSIFFLPILTARLGCLWSELLNLDGVMSCVCDHLAVDQRVIGNDLLYLAEISRVRVLIACSLAKISKPDKIPVCASHELDINQSLVLEQRNPVRKIFATTEFVHRV